MYESNFIKYISDIKNEVDIIKNNKDRIDIKCVSLEIIKNNNKDRFCVRNITNNYNIMKFIGGSRVWNANNVNNFFKFIDIENKQNIEDRINYCWKIKYKDICIGLVWIKIQSYNLANSEQVFNKDDINTPTLTVFLLEEFQGLSIGKYSIENAIRLYKSYRKNNSLIIYIDVKNCNTNMIKIMEKSNYKFIGEFMLFSNFTNNNEKNIQLIRRYST